MGVTQKIVSSKRTPFTSSSTSTLVEKLAYKTNTSIKYVQKKPLKAMASRVVGYPSLLCGGEIYFVHLFSRYVKSFENLTIS